MIIRWGRFFAHQGAVEKKIKFYQTITENYNFFYLLKITYSLIYLIT